jgi:type I restriction enzyme S subunit
VFASYLIRLKIREKVLPEFLAWFFRSDAYWRQIKPRGAAQPNINAEVLGTIKVRYPDSETEQHRIVSYFEDIQAEIDEMGRLQTQNTELLDQLEQSILERAFRGKI